MHHNQDMKDGKTESITFRTWPEIKAKIEDVAKGLDRSAAWVINNKLKEMLSDQEKQNMDNARGAQ